MKILDKFVWGTNDEFFSSTFHDTREQAEAEALRELEDGQEFYTGQVEELEIKDLCPKAHMVIDEMKENALCACGEPADEFLDGISKEDEALLQDKIVEGVSTWLTSTGNYPSFYAVRDVKKYERTQATT